MTEETKRMTGVVKWFNTTRGFGFITPDNDSADFFFHQSAIESGFELDEGDPVSFEPTLSPKGKQAIVVRKLLENDDE